MMKASYTPSFAVLFVCALCFLCTYPAHAAYTRIKDATPYAGHGRSLGNKVQPGFRGYVDVWSNSDADVFATNIKCDSGQAAGPVSLRESSSPTSIPLDTLPE